MPYTNVEGGGAKFSAVLIDDAAQFPVIHKNKIIQAASSIGIDLSSESAGKNAFAVTLICGLLNAEEGILSLLYSIIKDQSFQIAGGSAGDDLKFKETYVCANGKASKNAGVVLFCKTQKKFIIHKENIFRRSGKSVLLTDVQPESHLVKAIDGQTPRTRYANILGIRESDVQDAILDHPFGRVFGDNVFIASLIQFNPDGTLSTYARVLQDTMQEILEPEDAVTTAGKTCEAIKAEIPRPGVVLFFNCILRTIGFQKKNQQAAVNAVWHSHFPIYSGFSTYGEQFGHINSNQTLVSLIIEE